MIAHLSFMGSDLRPSNRISLSIWGRGNRAFVFCESPPYRGVCAALKAAARRSFRIAFSANSPLTISFRSTTVAGMLLHPKRLQASRRAPFRV